MIFDVLKEEYLDGICLIEQHSFSHPWSRYAFERELENSVAKYTVAVKDGEVVAYGGLWHILDEGHITNIAVHKDHRRKGIGDALLKELIKQGKKDGNTG